MSTTDEIIGQIAEIQTLRKHLNDTIAQCDAAALSDAAPSGLYEDQIEVAIWLKELRRKCAKMIAETYSVQEKLEIQAKIKPLVEHIVEQGDTPGRLSLKYYGTPHDWPKILQKNNLTGPDLTVGETLIIPQ